MYNLFKIYSIFSGNFYNMVYKIIFNDTNEGLQAVVYQSKICPLSLRALRSKIWLCKINTRSYVNLFSYRSNRCNFLRRFAKPYLWFLSFLTRSSEQYINMANSLYRINANKKIITTFIYDHLKPI